MNIIYGVSELLNVIIYIIDLINYYWIHIFTDKPDSRIELPRKYRDFLEKQKKFINILNIDDRNVLEKIH